MKAVAEFFATTGFKCDYNTAPNRERLKISFRTEFDISRKTAKIQILDK